MVRKKLSSEEIEAFRARSVLAAEALFAQGGIGAVTMRNLASELGCSATMPYSYFDNHEALISALRGAVFARFADSQREVAQKPGSARHQLARIGRAYVDFALQHPDAYKLMFTLEPPKERYPELERETKRSFAPLLSAMKDAVKTGEVQGPASTAAHLFWAQLHGLVSLQFANKFNFGTPLEELLEAVLGRLVEARKRGAKKDA
jgi:AcrR family transcriptional regulator